MGKKNYFLQRLDRDDYFDEIRILDEDRPIMRAFTRYRFKTSQLSGDEWRTSVMWQFFRGIRQGWEDYDGPYRDLRAACAGAYPGIYKSHSDLHGKVCAAVDFYRKGMVVYRSTYDDKPIPLLESLGHLPWALIMAGESDGGGFPMRRDIQNLELCDQPGCSNKAVSVYGIVKEGCRRCGNIKEKGSFRIGKKRPYARRFCKKHLRRGNSCLDDMDDFYEVLEGPGPDDAEGWQEHENPARRIVLDVPDELE